MYKCCGECEAGCVQNDTRELELRVRALERTLAERRARSQQASASQSMPAVQDKGQSPYGRDADRGARTFQLEQPQNQFAGAPGAGLLPLFLWHGSL